ncbi:bpX5 domain-containing protein [Pseudoduganella sp. HUAS MS19]
MAMQWLAQEAALAPAGAVACGRAAHALLRQLQLRSDAQRQGLRFVATADMLVLLGDAGQLPWVDGIRYCAASPEAPMLWLPTLLRPGLPVDLLQHRLLHEAGRGPVLLWPEPSCFMPLDAAAPLDEAALQWLAGVLSP